MDNIEYMKCSMMPKYFFENYLYTIHAIEGKVPLNLYSNQERNLADFMTREAVHHRSPNRRVGTTTLNAAFVLWYALFKDNSTIAVLGPRRVEAKKIISRIREHLFDLSEADHIENPSICNQDRIEFANGSKIFAGPVTTNSLRGIAPDLIVCEQLDLVKWEHVEYILEIIKMLTERNQTGKAIICW